MSSARGARAERLPLALATVFGVGNVPLAPGTFGSAVGVLLALVLARGAGQFALAAAALLLVPIGIWAAGVAERRLARQDPPSVVIDEVAGQLLALLGLADGWLGLLVGFALFRLFDITKPWPARRLEALPAGSGIMADDLVAALYANVLHQLLRWGFSGWWGTW